MEEAQKKEGEWGRGKGELSLSFPLIRFLFHSLLFSIRAVSHLSPGPQPKGYSYYRKDA